MLYLNKPNSIFLYGPAVDFRKQINGLCHLVEAEFKKELFKNNWFVFVARDKKKVKILYWRSTGFALWQFRLDDSRFEVPVFRDDRNFDLNWKSLSRFIAGYNVFEGQPHTEIKPIKF